MHQPPTGTVAFLFTDIEGSTRAWERDRAAMAEALARHDELLARAIEAEGGYIFKTIGDAFCAAFATAHAATRAALAAQRALTAEPWAQAKPVRARMAVHLGSALERGGDYFGPAVNRVARLLSIGHGGQVLVSQAAALLLRDAMPEGTALRDMGNHRLKDLEVPEHVFQLLAPGLPDAFPPLVSLDGHRTNLPVQLSPFIGREQELDAVLDLLVGPETRLVTLTGPGGSGKTRLALQAAADAAAAFPDGVFAALLDPVRDPALVPATIAEALGVRETAGMPVEQALKDYVSQMRLLLVLDNFEQVADAATFVADLLRAAPGLKALVTSRTPLRISGEREFGVPPLELPEKVGATADDILDCAAVRLLAERARSVRSDFAVTSENAHACAEICRRLDGLPLAIELAAARLKLLPPRALLDRLARVLPLLTDGGRDVPERQRTLRGAIAWSFDLLTSAEQTLFRRCAAFTGEWTLEAIEAVCNPTGELGDDVFDELARLADHSLLRPTRETESGARFAMLAVVREFALEQLVAAGEERATRERHARFFLQLAEGADGQLSGPDQAGALARLTDEHDNLRAALAWTLGTSEDQPAGDPLLGRRLAASLWRFWEVRGHFTEGRRWLEAAASFSGDDAERATVLHGAGVLALRQGDDTRATELIESAIAIRDSLGDRAGLASALTSLATVAGRRGDLAWQSALLEQALADARGAGDSRGMARALNELGNAAERREDWEQAEARYTEALAAHRAVGDQRSVAVCLNNLGLLAFYRNDHARAEVLHGDALDVFRSLGDLAAIATSLNNLGLVAQDVGDAPKAVGLFDEALAIRRDLGDRRGVLRCFTNLGALARETGDFERATGQLEEALRIARELDSRADIAYALMQLGRVVKDQRQLEEALTLFQESAALWREIGHESQLALALIGAGDVLRERGEVARAAGLYAEVCMPLLRHEHLSDLGMVLERLAALAVATRDADGAALLLGVAERLQADRESASKRIDSERDRIVRGVRDVVGEAELANGRVRGRALSLVDAVVEAVSLADQLAATAPS